jgi:hypothetical protein
MKVKTMPVSDLSMVGVSEMWCDNERLILRGKPFVDFPVKKQAKVNQVNAFPRFA